MGFYEDDRVRHKNRLYNEADDHYQSLRKLGLSDANIIRTCETKMRATSEVNSTRNEIYLTVIRMVKGSHDETAR